MNRARHAAVQDSDRTGFVPFTSSSSNRLNHTRERMQHTGPWSPQHLAGRRWTAACVSLETTQRCNLDCALCCLSKSAEAVRDFPLEEVFRRIDAIAKQYGAVTDVRMSGGEPTPRQRDELLTTVQRLASKGLRPALLTYGIKVSRGLLIELAKAGPKGVAFYVSTKQQRLGDASEADLNARRMDHINRARGLPIGVFVTTTVHAGNFGDGPMLSAFFVAQADIVRFASFELQDQTRLGVLGQHADLDAHGGFFAQADKQPMMEGLGQDERLAHMTNAHNVSAVFSLLQSGIPDSNAAWRKVKFLALRDLSKGGSQMSLYKFENDVIRPNTRCRAAAPPRRPSTAICVDLIRGLLPGAAACAVQRGRTAASVERRSARYFCRPETSEWTTRIARCGWENF